MSSTASSTESESGYSTSTTPMDSETKEEEERKSWKQYRDNLKHLFYCFAGHTVYARKKGLYMDKNEVKRFLEIVHIADFWSVDQVFEQMDSSEVDGKVKIEAIKKHIEKQISWQLLLKALNIFNEVDQDHS